MDDLDRRALMERQRLLRGDLVKRREQDPLGRWQPTAKQMPFINAVLRGPTYTNYLVAANRCLTPWTPVEMGSATRLPVEVLGERAFDVRSWDGASRCTRRASAVFLKGIEPAFRIHLDNGEAFEASGRHRVLTPAGWASLGSLLSIPDDPHSTGRGADSGDCCDTDSRRYGQRLPLVSGSGRVAFPPVADARQHIRLADGRVDGVAPTPARIHACLASFHHSNPDDPHLIEALCDLWTTDSADTTDPPWFYHSPDAPPFLGALDPLQEELRFLAPLVREGSAVAYCALPSPILLIGGVRLIGYQKIGLQPIIDFTVEGTHCYIAAGAIHHNSGKSDAGAYCGATLARFGVDPLHGAHSSDGRIEIRDRATSGWVVSLDFPASRDTIQPKYFESGSARSTHPPFIPDREIAKDGWRVSDQILKLRNGSIIGFKSADSGPLKFQGSEKDWIHFDEEPPKNVADEAGIRVGAGRRLRQFYTCTLLPPEGQVGGVSWIFSEIIQPWEGGSRPDLGVFGASIYDNPHLEQAEFARLEAMYPEGSVSRRIRLGGEWLPGLSGARAYPGFSRALNSHLQPALQTRRPLAWFFDFNVAPMVSGLGQRDGRLFRVFKEFILDEGNVLEMVDWVRQEIPSHGAEVWIYGDATGKGRDAGTGKSDYQLILNAMRGYPAPVRLKVPEVNPHVVDRINAVNNACRDEHGEVLLDVDPGCRDLIADMEQVQRDVRGKIRKTSNQSDPYFRRTHISDALGYWISYEMPIRAHGQITQRATPTIKEPTYAWSGT